jgi:hypothetical protein
LHANLIAYYRDHALLAYRHLGSKLRPELRRFPNMADVLLIAVQAPAEKRVD